MIFPVCPTCKLGSIIPWSTAALVPPTTKHETHFSKPAAPNLSASLKRTSNCFLSPAPRPPTTTREAVTREGLDDKHSFRSTDLTAFWFPSAPWHSEDPQRSKISGEDSDRTGSEEMEGEGEVAGKDGTLWREGRIVIIYFVIY